MKDIDTIKRDEEKIVKIAEAVSKMDDISAFPFINFDDSGPNKYPAEGNGDAIDIFSVEIMHDFGFWYGDGKGYVEPMYAEIHGDLEKGSDFHHYSWMRAYEENPEIIDPETLASFTVDDVKYLYRDDEGNCPIPMVGERTELTKDYGRTMQEMGFDSAKEMLESCDNYLVNDGEGFLEVLDNFKGYNTPLRKKSNLLRMILENRPEKFLEPEDPQNRQPIIDYHIQRTMLRTGIVKPGNFEDILSERKWIGKEAHDKIRSESYKAFQNIVEKSGKEIAAVDDKFFGARKYCPEMEEPECSDCSLIDACDKNKDLFQPVFRTTYY